MKFTVTEKDEQVFIDMLMEYINSTPNKDMKIEVETLPNGEGYQATIEIRFHDDPTHQDS